MSGASIAALVIAAVGLAINVALIVWRGGQLSAALTSVQLSQDVSRKEQEAARAESAKQHEATQSKIAELAKSSAVSDATAEHQRRDIDDLRVTVTKISARIDENDRAQTAARHAQTESLTTTLATLVTAAVSRELAERDARGNGRPRR